MSLDKESITKIEEETSTKVSTGRMSHREGALHTLSGDERRIQEPELTP